MTEPIYVNRHPRQIASLLCALTVFPLVAAADRTPANFEGQDPKRLFSELLEFPDVSGDTSITMLCASQIETSGKMKDTFCMVRNNAEAIYNKTVQLAAKKSRVKPAVIDGKKYKVYLQFRVEFIKEGDSKRIIVYANTGDAENIEAYGKDFIAAQRVIGKEPWMKVCPARAQFGITARAHVNIDGIASNVSMAHGYGIRPTGSCQQAIIDTIEASLFTPALADGVAVPSAYVEPFGN
jgi:hypothetical protein